MTAHPPAELLGRPTAQGSTAPYLVSDRLRLCQTILGMQSPTALSAGAGWSPLPRVAGVPGPYYRQYGGLLGAGDSIPDVGEWAEWNIAHPGGRASGSGALYLFIGYSQAVNGGRIDVTVDGAAQGQIEGYAAATVWVNALYTLAGPQRPGIRKVRLTHAGKHASSTNHFWAIAFIALYTVG